MPLKKIERKLNEIINVDLPIIKKIKKFVTSSGGKRIRPLIHFYFVRLLGYKGNEWIDVGAIGEIIHAASLLHDDVVDQSELRRGKPTINKIYNNKTSVLSGDFLLACALDHLGKLKHSQVLLQVFTRVIRMLAVGELIQMEWELNIKTPVKVYEKIIRYKTAVLFGAMTQSAAILSDNGNIREQIRCRNFGERLGRIFQIRDDYLDYFGKKQINGKEIFQDFKRGLVTLPIIRLRSVLKGKELRELEKIWLNEKQRNDSAGIENLLNLAQEKKVDLAITAEIEAEIKHLLRFVDKYPQNEFSEKIRNNLLRLTV